MIYLARGKHEEAGWSAVFAIPGIIKRGKKGGKAVGGLLDGLEGTKKGGKWIKEVKVVYKVSVDQREEFSQWMKKTLGNLADNLKWEEEMIVQIQTPDGLTIPVKMSIKETGEEAGEKAVQKIAKEEGKEAAEKVAKDALEGGSGALKGSGKIPKSGDSDFMGSLTKSEQHFIYGDGIGPKKRGVLGAHNLKSFDNTLKSTGYSLEDLKVGDPIPHPTVDGVYAQYYRVPAYDGRGNFIGFKDIPDPKTYYDPDIISDSQMLQWGKEAMNNASPIGDGGYLIKGTASNGLEFYGYLRDGEITNFFPSVPK